MQKLTLLILLTCCYTFVNAQGTSKKTHYACFQHTGEYHDKEHCPRLQMCTGGKIKRITNVNNLTACPKCVKTVDKNPEVVEVKKTVPKSSAAGFSDIKRILGVKDRKQIADSLGTDAAVIHRPEGYTIRITGLPGSRTVNTIDFTFDNPVAFAEDTLFNERLFHTLGLKFTGCKSDTIRQDQNKISITYKGCAIVEPRDQYEDTSTYFYELVYLAKDGDGPRKLDRIKLLLRFEGDR